MQGPLEGSDCGGSVMASRYESSPTRGGELFVRVVDRWRRWLPKRIVFRVRNNADHFAGSSICLGLRGTNMFAKDAFVREEEVRSGLIQDANRICVDSVEFREISSCKNLSSRRCEVIGPHDVRKQVLGLLPVSFHRGGAFIAPALF